MLVAAQLFIAGSYLPPLLKYVKKPSYPPHTIISLLVQTDVCEVRPAGALAVLVVSHVLVLGLYLPPVLTKLNKSPPPHTTISVPVHMDV